MPNDSIFEADELAADAQGPEAETPETQPRGPDGKFAPKADPDPAPDPDVNDSAEAQPGEDDGKGGTVPHAALHTEREKRKASDAKASQLEAELTAARETLANIQRLRDEAAARKPEPLPAADDPAAMEHLRSRIEQQDQRLNQFSQQQDMAAADLAEIQQLGAVIASSETEFRATTPDYDAAIDHVVQARAHELTLYGLTPVEIEHTIKQEVLDIARSAVQQGRNPAELGYQIAKSRGYRPAQTDPAPANGAQATLDAIARAQGASKSLGAGAGSTPQTLNAEAIARMNADEFDRLYSTPEGRALIDNL